MENTLPAAQIRSEMSIQGDKFVLIIASSARLAKSYESIGNVGANVDVLASPSHYSRKFIFYFIIVLFVKIKKLDLIFFHECCNPILDLMIHLMSPMGQFYPQVTLFGWEKIPKSEYPSKKIKYMLSIFGYLQKFSFYKSQELEHRQPDYAIAAREYPDSIKRYPLPDHERIVSDLPRNKVLFIVGVSYCSSEKQIAVYSKLIDLAAKNGFECFVKDHPNPKFRLGCERFDGFIIEPHIPIELLKDDFKIVIGLNSTALTRFPKRAYSILNLLPDLNEHGRRSILSHFQAINIGSGVKFAKSIFEFEHVFQRSQ